MTTWLITGISRGLGKALTEAALERGDTVVGTQREASPDIAHSESRLHVLSFEAADPLAARHLVDRAYALAGRVDILVNNAGYGLLGAVEEASDAEVAHLFDVNVFGPFRLIRAVLPHFRAHGSGHIVNITSIAGRAPTASSALYAAAKSAMEGLSQSLAQEVGPLGIRVTAVAPGGFRTDFLSDRSICRSEATTGAYAASVGAALANLNSIAGRQIGDPQRAASAIFAAVDAKISPLHLLLGSDASRRARDKLAAVIAEMDQWEAVSRSTDYPKEV